MAQLVNGGCWMQCQKAVVKLEHLLTCFVCDKVMDDPHTLGGCDHHFCRLCISHAMQETMNCPVCGLPVWIRDLKTNRQIENLIKLVSDIRDLLSQSCNFSKPSTYGSAKMTSEPATISNTSIASINNERRNYDDGVFKKPRLFRKRAIGYHTHVHVPCPVTNLERTERPFLDSNFSHCPSIQSPLLSVQKSCDSLTTTIDSTRSNIDTIVHKRRHSVFRSYDKPSRPRKRPSFVLDEVADSISSNGEFPFSPMVTKTRNYSKLDKSAKLHRLQQAGYGSNAVTKTSPARLTSQQAKTMRRNIRGETPLHIASIKGDADEVISLLKQGADPNVKDNAGWTSLHEACNHGHTAVVTVLLNNNALINVPGFDNDTPLHDAVANGHVDIARLLLRRGAILNIKNRQGLIALDFACSDEMKKVFSQHSASSSVQISPNAIVSPHTSPEQSGGSNQVVILCTGLKLYQKNRVEELASLLGVRVVNSFSTNVSHIVTNCNSSKCCSRTLKFLCGVAKGKWIVSFQWVTDSLEAKSWTNEINYEIKGVTVGDSNLVSDAPKKGRENAIMKLPGLFDGCEIFLSGLFAPPQASKDELGKLIKLADGQLLAREPIYLPHTTHPYHMKQGSKSKPCSTFVVCDPFCEQRDKYVVSSRRTNVKIVPASWLLDCLSCFEIIPCQQ
ncbi:BRCA1-associated RING domain protein 1-like isoform X2 [Halichondria panicea]|uniref:BRCA1-associated RING domain protein 1-like isoform X2 n=1 Tax=Halichondria panicea TaxID=6063 RepID=UPI00312B99AE